MVHPFQQEVSQLLALTSHRRPLCCVCPILLKCCNTKKLNLLRNLIKQCRIIRTITINDTSVVWATPGLRKLQNECWEARHGPLRVQHQKTSDADLSKNQTTCSPTHDVVCLQAPPVGLLVSVHKPIQRLIQQSLSFLQEVSVKHFRRFRVWGGGKRDQGLLTPSSCPCWIPKV